MSIRLGKETQKVLLDSIKRFFADEMEEDIGDLKAARVLEFVVQEIGPSIYNQAIADARAYMEEKASELSEARYQPEYDYWKKR